jgi:hypothetical protein
LSPVVIARASASTSIAEKARELPHGVAFRVLLVHLAVDVITASSFTLHR